MDIISYRPSSSTEVCLADHELSSAGSRQSMFPGIIFHFITCEEDGALEL